LPDHGPGALSKKAPEDWRSPRRFAKFGNHGQRMSLLDCGSPLPLFIRNARVGRFRSDYLRARFVHLEYSNYFEVNQKKIAQAIHDAPRRAVIQGL
jgi:hypothetical protein